MTLSFPRAIVALLVFAVAGLTIAYAGDPPVGSAVPEIKAEGWVGTDGKTVSLADLKGKVVVVEFWATWCPPCRDSIPHLIGVQEKRKKDGLVIVGLSDETKDVVEPFVKGLGVNYIVGWGSQSRKDYGVKGIPRAFVIGADGKLVWSGHPMKAEFEKAVDDALAAAGKKA